MAVSAFDLSTIPKDLTYLRHVVKHNRKYGLLLLALLASSIYYRRKMKAVNRKKNGGAKGKKKNRPKVDKVFFKRLKKILKIVVPSLQSKEFYYILILTGLLLARTWLSLKITHLLGTNTQCLVSHQYKEMAYGVFQFFLITIPASAVSAGLKYFTSMVALQYRVNLSHHVHQKYLDGVNFYKATSLGENKIDHADQRVTSDINNFSTAISELYTTITKPMLEVILFTSRLAGITGWQGPLIMFSYFAFSAFMKNNVIPSLGPFVAKESQLEGAYRTAHKRLIVNSEEIAFYNGSSTEKRIINNSLYDLVDHKAHFNTVRGIVSVCDNLIVKYWASIAGYGTMMAPMFFGVTKYAGKSTHEMTRDYILTSRYLGGLADAVGELVMAGNKLMRISGYTSRVCELLEMVNALDNSQMAAFKESEIENANTNRGSKIVAASSDFLNKWSARCHQRRAENSAGWTEKQVNGGGVIKYSELITFNDVDVVSPEGKVLVSKLNFEVTKNVMVTGPNGCGKSSLFRVIGELWPLHCGVMTKPREEDIVFVPQKPYLVKGTLRDQIIYPHSLVKMKSLNVTDEDLRQLLKIVDPEERILNAWSLNDERDWFSAMSMGQMQRIAAARLFYHHPIYAILDECTSAVSGDVEDTIYETCKKLNIKIFSVSHRPSLMKFHQVRLHYDGRGGYELIPIEESQIQKGVLCE